MSDNNYGFEVQSILLSYMLADPTAFTMSQNIISPSFFDNRLRAGMRYILDFSEKYRTMPTILQIKAETGVDVLKFDVEDVVEDGLDAEEIEAKRDAIRAKYRDWYLEKIESFCRYKALESAVLDGVTLIDEGKQGELERRIKDAMAISLMRDLGTEYFRDPQTRLENMRDRSNYVSTGWKVIDDKLYGGFTPGALNVWAGGSGSGKSLFLQNIALNWAFMGKNVIYFTLELSEDLVALRLDAMVAGIGTKDVFRDITKAALVVKMKGQKAGTLIVKKLPEAGTTANDLRAFLKEYQIKTGIKPDAIIVDYLDLMHPNGRTISASDLFVKDKYTSEEMRALAGEMNLLCVTASQLNRASVEAQEFDHSHIAGGISKINTADNVFGIFTSPTMRERGTYQIQFLKTRSSSAVGQKAELKYCPISLRISDPEDYDDTQKTMTREELQQELKEKTTLREAIAEKAKEQSPIPAVTNDTKTKALDIMNRIKAKDNK